MMTAKKTKEDYISALEHLGYRFAMNSTDDSIEVNGKPLTDGQAAHIYITMRDLGFNSRPVLDAVIQAQAWQHQYHPIKDYLHSLKWDGKPHIYNLAANHFVDEHGAFPLLLRKWLIGSVAKTMQQAFNPMLVLDGEQRLGKSKFAQWLASPMDDYYIERPIMTSNDDLIRLSRIWIWEVAELGATIRKTDREALKNFVSTMTIQARRPYGRYDIRKPALASFIGTINNEGGFLADPTGHRRFWPCHLLSIDWRGYTAHFDPDDLWAEAYAAYLAGEGWTLDDDEQELVNTIADTYEIDDPIEGLVKKYFVIDPARIDWWLSTQEILSTLEDGGLRGTTKSNAMYLASTMTKLKLRKRRGLNGKGNRVNGYEGIMYAPTLGGIP